MSLRRKVYFTLFTIFLIFLIYFFYSFGPSNVVELVGVQNTYLILFIIAMIGGVSAFTSGTFYAVFITFLLGGSNPILLSVIGGLGLTIGDSLFFYFGYKGREVANKTRFKERLHKLSHWLKGHSESFIFGLVYLYVSFAPFPKDIVSVILGLLNFRFRIAIFAFFLGNITHCLAISYLIL